MPLSPHSGLIDSAYDALRQRITQGVAASAIYKFNKSVQESSTSETDETELDTGDEYDPVEAEEEGVPIGIANDEAELNEAEAQQVELDREEATKQNAELVNEAAAQMAELVFTYMELKELYDEATGTIALHKDDYKVNKLRNGVTAEQVYDRPYGAYYGQLAEGATPEQALQSANAALTRSVETDMQLAQTHAARNYMQASPNITGWMRSPDAGACVMCTQAAQGQVYPTADLMPIHEHCGCGVTPVTVKNPSYARITDTYHDDEIGPHFDEYAAKPITEAEARGNSRPVSMSEFRQLANEGRAKLATMKANASPITGLTKNLDSIKADAYKATRESWGGQTIDAHTGEKLASDADKYAITVKPPGINTVSIDEKASEDEFNKAIDKAVSRFKPELQQQDHYLGIFHDDDKGMIDFDPVVVVDNVHDVETIGSYTHAVGGAYHFASGDGYWPPHVVPTLKPVPDALWNKAVAELEEKEEEESTLVDKYRSHIQHHSEVSFIGGGVQPSQQQTQQDTGKETGS